MLALTTLHSCKQSISNIQKGSMSRQRFVHIHTERSEYSKDWYLKVVTFPNKTQRIRSPFPLNQTMKTRRVIIMYSTCTRKLAMIRELQNHRMAWVGRDLKDHEYPMLPLQTGLPASTSNTRPYCPGPYSPGPEHLQGQSIHNLCGQPVPAPHHSHSKEFPPVEPVFPLRTHRWESRRELTDKIYP